jgi:hypothetical protein
MAALNTCRTFQAEPVRAGTKVLIMMTSLTLPDGTAFKVLTC